MKSWYHSLFIPDVIPFCSLALSAPFWFCMRASFMQNQKPDNQAKNIVDCNSYDSKSDGGII